MNLYNVSFRKQEKSPDPLCLNHATDTILSLLFIRARKMLIVISERKKILEENSLMKRLIEAEREKKHCNKEKRNIHKA